MVPFLLFESLRPDETEDRSFAIDNPIEILACDRLEDVERTLLDIEARVRDGNIAAGFLSYEAGLAFLPRMPALRPPSLPLVWFAIARKTRPAEENRRTVDEPPQVQDLRLSRTPAEYEEAIGRIKAHIERGDTYQVNYTMKYRGHYDGAPVDLYRMLRRQQRVNYAALIQTDDWAIASLSPELFFRKTGDRVEMRPMKGTIARGRTLREDRDQARALRESPKETAENLMIVDMLRNDLGRICKIGSIRVTDPMRVERYESLLQMTTSIEGQPLEDVGITELFRATFPSGSITGAPKVRTMQIIDELEAEPRGIYTGAIGYISQERSVFNVAIRTAFIDRRTGDFEMGVGSGILYEADPFREYRECELKARFFQAPREPFRLFETLLWTPEAGYAHLELHLTRLLESAEYFLFPANEGSLRQRLQTAANSREPAPRRVRLLLDEEGGIEVESTPLEPLESSPRICLSRLRVDSSDPFLFHKTTNRAVYDAELRAARLEGCFDVVFRNERDEITEGAISNIVIRKGDEYLTPPVESGLLAGTCRAFLLQSQTIPLREQILREEDLRSADAIYVTNALRGMIQVRLEDSPRSH